MNSNKRKVWWFVIDQKPILILITYMINDIVSQINEYIIIIFVLNASFVKRKIFESLALR